VRTPIYLGIYLVKFVVMWELWSIFFYYSSTPVKYTGVSAWNMAVMTDVSLRQAASRPSSDCYLLLLGFLLGLFFDSKVGGEMFLRNVG
jgi:hypothetical protein